MRCMVANGLGIQKGYFITSYGEKNLELQNFFANDAKCCKNVIVFRDSGTLSNHKIFHLSVCLFVCVSHITQSRIFRNVCHTFLI